MVFISRAVRAESECVLASKVRVDTLMTCIILESGVEGVLFRCRRLCSSQRHAFCIPSRAWCCCFGHTEEAVLQCETFVVKPVFSFFLVLILALFLFVDLFCSSSGRSRSTESFGYFICQNCFLATIHFEAHSGRSLPGIRGCQQICEWRCFL